MTDYTHPLKDALFNLHHVAGVDDVLALERFGDFDGEVVDQVVEEAGKFAAAVIAPLNIPGDQQGSQLVDGKIVAAPGFAEAYAQFAENGWQGVAVPPEFDGMGMPELVSVATTEAWQTACLAFSLGPMLTGGAIAALQAHATDELCERYIPKMATGEWAGTMDLTEPQAGSDLAAVATRAVPEAGHYRLTGAKIFITWGDHEMTENVLHLVLARLPDAPSGVKGISLFLVPKFLVNDDGSLGERNEVSVASIEHKLGIHGSPTCVLNYGGKDGAIGYLVGEENRGLACMFTMMNQARLEVGIQGLAISERAYQLARDYAAERVQGVAPGVEGRATIIHHADVRRMLLLMKAYVEAMRSFAYTTAATQDLSHHAPDADTRAQALRRVALLTPVVKGWMTEVAQEVTSLGVQVHGGMGYVEETGAAQHMRDARILPIYEGTNGIQAMDFAGRKILADDGREMAAMLGEIRALDAELAQDDRLADIRKALATGADELERAVAWLIAEAPANPHVPGAAAYDLMMLAGTVIGGWQMARAALAITGGAAADDPVFAAAKLATTRFYALHIMPRAGAHAAAAMAGAEVLTDLDEAGF